MIFIAFIYVFITGVAVFTLPNPPGYRTPPMVDFIVSLCLGWLIIPVRLIKKAIT